MENIITIVYKELQSRKIHPAGEFDGGGRFYLTNNDLVNVRTPSRSWPYSQMVAGRTKKYVKRVAEKFNCKNIETLRRAV